MPTYNYYCSDCDSHFSYFQKMSELPISNCEICRGKVKRLITGGTGLIFKGTGFYLTDYKNGGKSKDSEKPAESGKEKSDKTVKTEKGEKPAPKAKESSSKKKENKPNE